MTRPRTQSVQQFAARAGVSPRRVRQWIAAKRVRARKVAGIWIVYSLARPQAEKGGRPRVRPLKEPQP